LGLLLFITGAIALGVAAAALGGRHLDLPINIPRRKQLCYVQLVDLKGTSKNFSF
jgi:hypothetical protein